MRSISRSILGNSPKKPQAVGARKLQFTGAFFDGRSARKYQAAISLSPRQLALSLEDGKPAHVWDYPDLKLRTAGDPGKPPFHLEHSTVSADSPALETLVVDDPEFLENLRRIAAVSLHPTLKPAGGWKYLFIAAAVLAVPLFLYGLWKGAIPALADRVALRVPVAWEAELGDKILKELPQQFSPVADAEQEKVLEAIAERLLDTVSVQPYSFRFHVVPQKTVNAMALPGGRVLVFQGLLDTTESAEELAGVLAHEIQHVLLRHSTRGIVRAMASRILLTLVTGDTSGVMDKILGVAGELQGLAHSREMELEADRLGMEMILRAGIDPRGAVRMFEKLQEQEIGLGVENETPAALEEESLDWLEYLSTHPAGKDRVSQLKKQVALAEKKSYILLLPGLDWKKTLHREGEAKK